MSTNTPNPFNNNTADPAPTKEPEAMPQNDLDSTTVRLPRVTLDLKVPIWAVGSAFAGLVWALVSMYFQLMTQSTQLAEMQALLKQSSSMSFSTAGDMALLRYRIEKLEGFTHNSLKER
jgi:hypothetical protein